MKNASTFFTVKYSVLKNERITSKMVNGNRFYSSLMFVIFFAITFSHTAHSIDCLGRIELPEISEDLISWANSSPRTGCLIERTTGDQSELCECLNQKSPQEKFRLRGLSQALRTSLEDYYIQKAGERLQSKIFSVFNDLLVFDARLKQGSAINQNFLSLTNSCRLNKLQESVSQLERDSGCNNSTFRKRKNLIFGSGGVSAYVQGITSRIESVSANRIPPAVQGRSSYCMSYKSYLGMAEPSLQSFEDLTSIRREISQDPEIDLNDYIPSIHFGEIYSSNPYMANPILNEDYYNLVMRNGNSTIIERSQLSDEHMLILRARQNGLITRLAGTHHAFTRSIASAEDVNDFIYSPQINKAMLLSFDDECNDLFSADNLKKLLCQESFPNMSPNTLMQEIGPDLFREELGQQLGTRVNELTFATFLCNISSDGNTITASTTYQTVESGPMENLLDPETNFTSDLETLSNAYDRTRRLRTPYEIFNEEYCDAFRESNLLGPDGHLKISAITAPNIEAALISMASNFHGEDSTEMARIRSEVLPLIRALPEHLNEFENESHWTQIRNLLGDILDIDRAAPILDLLNKVLRRDEREDYVLRTYARATEPFSRERDPLAAATATYGGREGFLAHLRETAPDKSPMDRMLSPGDHETGFTEDSSDVGSSIFTNYFLHGSATDEVAMEEHQDTLLTYREVVNPLADLAWTAEGNPLTGSTDAVPPVPYRREPLSGTSSGTDPNTGEPGPTQSSGSSRRSGFNFAGTDVNPLLASPDLSGPTSGASRAPVEVDTVADSSPVGPSASTLPGAGTSSSSSSSGRVASSLPFATSTTLPTASPLATFTNSEPSDGNSSGQAIAPSSTRHPLEDELASLQRDMDDLDNDIERLTSSSGAATGRGTRTPSTPGRIASTRTADTVASSRSSPVSNFNSSPRAREVNDRDAFGNSDFDHILASKKDFDNSAGAETTSQSESAGSTETSGAAGASAGDSKSAVAKDGKTNGAKGGAGGSTSVKGPLGEKRKSNKSGKGDILFSFEERLLFPHSVLEVNSTNSDIESFIELMGLEGKRWSTVEKLASDGKTEPHYRIRTFDIDIKKESDTSKKEKLKSPQFREELIRKIKQLRSSDSSESISELSQIRRKSTKVREVVLSETRLKRYSNYLATEAEILQRVFTMAEERNIP